MGDLELVGVEDSLALVLAADAEQARDEALAETVLVLAGGVLDGQRRAAGERVEQFDLFGGDSGSTNVTVAAIPMPVIPETDEQGRLERRQTVFAHVEPFPGANIEKAALEVNGIRIDNPLRLALPAVAPNPPAFGPGVFWGQTTGLQIASESTGLTGRNAGAHRPAPVEGDQRDSQADGRHRPHARGGGGLARGGAGVAEWPALLGALWSSLILNYFSTEPFGSLEIADAEEESDGEGRP